MKTKILPSLALVYFGLFVLIPLALAQTTAFTYQGQLIANGSLASGGYDLTFTLFPTNNGGSAIAGPITNSAVGVTNGLFTTTLDFGINTPNIFTGTNVWLEIAVQPTGGTGGFSTLSPRQAILPTPYSIYAQSAGGIAAGGIAGVPNMQVFTSSGALTVPSGVNKIMVEVWGGGGGGGGGDYIGYASGGGGGGGGFGRGVFGVMPGTTFTVTVGSGGSGGQAGGSSSFGALISASGGSAGGSPPQYDYNGGVGGGGGTSSGTFNSDGAKGSGGAVGSSLRYNNFLSGDQSYVAGGAGGAAGGGGGGGGGGGNANLVGTGGNGGKGSSPGGGGGGGGQGNTSVGSDGGTGGNGGNGRVVVYW